MKRIKLLMNLIASWQLLLASACLFSLVMRIYYSGFWGNPDLTFALDAHLMNFYLSFTNLLWKIFNIVLAVYFFIAVTNSLAWFKRKPRVYWLNIVSMVILLLTSAYLAYLTFGRMDSFPYSHLAEIIPTLLFMLLLILSGVLPVYFLTRPDVQAYFKKPQTEPDVVSSK
jgi:hypothetical protein